MPRAPRSGHSQDTETVQAYRLAIRLAQALRGVESPRKDKTPGLSGTGGFEDLERETRLELATPTLARSCSTN